MLASCAHSDSNKPGSLNISSLVLLALPCFPHHLSHLLQSSIITVIVILGEGQVTGSILPHHDEGFVTWGLADLNLHISHIYV
jgi:hypothetical protein